VKPEEFSPRIYGVLIRDGKVLLTRSLFKGRPFVNFPGGGIELEEPPKQALIREFQEETGLTPTLERVLYTSESCHLSTQVPIQIVSIYWLVKAEGEPETKGNGDDVETTFWAALEDIPTSEMFPAELEFVKELPGLL